MSYDVSVPCMWFGGAMAGNTFIIENYGYILGRGGSGGQATRVIINAVPVISGGPGSNGADGVIVDGGSVSIINYGIIGGGGGGGGANRTGTTTSFSFNDSPGGGGAPFGFSPISTQYRSFTGSWSSSPTQTANLGCFKPTFDLPARGNYSVIDNDGATGGVWGQPGSNSASDNPGNHNVFTPGSAGNAVRFLSGSFNWEVRGDVRGYAP